MRRRARLLAAAGGLVAATGTLAGCASADPAAAVAVGVDTGGYVAVVTMCDQGRTLTHAGYEEVDADTPEVSWVGRTVEPITYFRMQDDPPDNWVEEVAGGLRSDVEYRFVITDRAELTVEGPAFTLDDLNALGVDEVIDAAGTVSSMEEFLENACTG